MENFTSDERKMTCPSGVDLICVGTLLCFLAILAFPKKKFRKSYWCHLGVGIKISVCVSAWIP